MAPTADFSLTDADVATPDLDQRLAAERSLEVMARAARTHILTPAARQPFVQYPLVGVIGALLAWGIAAGVAWLPFFREQPVWRAMLPGAAASVVLAPALGWMFGQLQGHRRRSILTALLAFVLAAAGVLVTVPFGWGLDRLLVPGEADAPLRGLAWFRVLTAGCLGGAALGAPLLLAPGIVLRAAPLRFAGLAAGLLAGALAGLARYPLQHLLGQLGAAGSYLAAAAHALLFGLLLGLLFALFCRAGHENWLVLAHGPALGLCLPLWRSPLTFGSAAKADLRCTGDDQLLPLHATLTRHGLRWLLSDAGGAGGTYVNGQPIQQCLLADGDVITAGNTVLKYRHRRALS
jgi:hypothetical protein